MMDCLRKVLCIDRILRVLICTGVVCLMVVGCMPENIVLPGGDSDASAPSLEVSVPDGAVDYFAQGFSFARTADEVSMIFRVAEDWTVKVVDADGQPVTWCSLSSSLGSAGLHEMKVRVEENAGMDSRSARIMLMSFENASKVAVIEVHQDGVVISVPDGYTDYFAEELILDYRAGEAEVVFSVNVDWPMQFMVTDKEAAAWCSVEQSSSKDGLHKVKVHVTKNDTYGHRSATLRLMCDTVRMGDVRVIQNQENAILLGSRDYNVSADATTIEVALSANVDFEYTILDAGWVREQQAATRGLTTHKMVFEVDANPSHRSRSAQIVFRNSEHAVSDTLTLVQKGLVPKVTVPEGYTDYFTQGLEFDHMSDEAEVTFQVNVEWSLSVDGGASWLSVEPSSGAAGIQTVTVRVTENEQAVSRMATISLMGDTGNLATIEVKQEKKIFSLSRTTYSVSCEEGSINVELNANIDFEYKIIDADWIREQQSSHSQTKHSFVFGYDANTSVKGRNAQIVFYNSEYAISDTLKINQANVVEAVDLGLSVKWAPHNVGAESPEDYGGYYAWGETEEKSDYSWATYKWGDGNSFTKYSTADENNILDPEDDVASVLWGGDWRMPTLDDVRELQRMCTWEWTSVNGVNGYNVTAPNGNSIFFPAAGYRDGWGIYERKLYGDYRSATLYSNSAAYSLNFDSDRHEFKSGYRYLGLTVRPVSGDRLEDITVITEFVMNITEGGAKLSGTITNSSQSLTCGFIYGTTSSLSSTSGIKKSTTSKGDYSVSVTGLKGNTTYYYRAYVIVNGEYRYGEVKSFTTKHSEDNSNTDTDTDNIEAVDLGLSVKWASCNVGAESPEEYGDYFAWGETEPKSDYSWSTYKWCNGSYDTQTKYCTSSSYGTVDNKTVLDPEDDAATANWGGSWRMPTWDEIKELCNKCTWTWTMVNGVNGQKITGPNGNSIFLPATGYREGTEFSSRGSYGDYWPGTLREGRSYDAYYIYFGSDGWEWSGNFRYKGRSVRPVADY